MSARISHPFAAVLLALGLTGGAAAHAQETDRRTGWVRAGDLDLTTAAGAAALVQRVRLMAARVCGPAELIGALDEPDYEHCLLQAEQAAQARVTILIAAARSPARYAAR